MGIHCITGHTRCVASIAIFFVCPTSFEDSVGACIYNFSSSTHLPLQWQSCTTALRHHHRCKHGQIVLHSCSSCCHSHGIACPLENALVRFCPYSCTMHSALHFEAGHRKFCNK